MRVIGLFVAGVLAFTTPGLAQTNQGQGQQGQQQDQDQQGQCGVDRDCAGLGPGQVLLGTAAAAVLAWAIYEATKKEKKVAVTPVSP